MVSIVEISKARLETCSPMNEKHNILYHRARNNVNQRHVSKPWFDLNPMIDKDDDKGMDLDIYRPEIDRGVQAPDSLTIVEDYFSEKPLLTREFKIGQFWEFLFSENWSDGYSLRILEGRLQNLMFTCLLTLTQTGHVTRHSTRAFAKNRRKRYNIYKASTKPPEFGPYEETLLLEFRYYGLTVDMNPEVLTEYPNETTCSTVTTVSSEPESSEQDVKPAHNQLMVLKPHPPSNRKPPTSNNRRKLLQKRTTPSRALPPIQSPGRDQALIDKSLSRVLEAEHSSAVIPRGTWKREHRSDISTGSDEYPYVAQTLDLSKFMCTEKVSYLGEFELSDDSSSEEEEEEEPDYEQGLYLGDRAPGEPHTQNESVGAYLKRRRDLLQADRQQRRKLLQETNKPPRLLFPEFSELDVKKYLSDLSLKDDNVKREAEKVPELDEYIQILKEDDTVDIRYGNKSKRRTLNFQRRHNLIKPSTEHFADGVGAVTGSNACRMHCYSRDNIWGIMSEDSRKTFLVKKLVAAGVKVPRKPKKKVKVHRRKKPILEPPLIYVTTTLGITYLHPASRHMLLSQFIQPPKPVYGRRRFSLLLKEQTPLAIELNKKRNSSLTVPEVPSQESILAPTEVNKEEKVIFPKAKPLVIGTESPILYSDEEEDGLEECQFNTKKLHMQYSLERIKKSKSARRKRNNKTLPEFYQVLKKYYRMQSILRAFTPASRRRSSVTSHQNSISSGLPTERPKQRNIKRGFLKPLRTLIQEEKDKTEVGKMKWFRFLEAKRKLVEPEDDSDDELFFENYPMDLFRKNLKRALEMFVVRREVVISDYNAKASVSITMTRKSVFVKSRNPHM